MTMFNRLSLRSILLIDGIVSGAMGLLLLIGAGILDSMLDLPTALLRTVGVVLIPWMILLAAIAMRRVISRSIVRIVIAVNLGWVAASILLLFTGWVEPNALGVVFILVQAMAVVVFALAQIAKQAEAAPAAPAQANRSFQV